jgi:hypothetical protein
MIKFERKSIVELRNKYSVGKKQDRAILKYGDEVTILNNKYKHLAHNICDFLNGNHIKCNQMEFNIKEQILISNIKHNMLNIILKKQKNTLS